MMKKILWSVFFIAVLFAVLFFSPKETTESATEFYMDTVVRMTVTGENPSEWIALCKQTFAFYDKLWGKMSENGDIYRINHSDGQWVTVSEETIALLKEAADYHELSDGKFSIGIGALSSLWDYKKHTVPDMEAIAKAKHTVRDDCICIQGNRVKLAKKNMQLDLGAIAKGKITDTVVRKLRENGCRSALLDVGGNVYALGEKKKKTPWRIGVRDPLQESGSYFAILNMKDMAVVSSGDYERVFSENGKSYHHILDPSTGYPAQTDLCQATILHSKATDADALSTIIFMMGMQKGKEFLEKNDFSGILVSKTGETVYVNCELYMEDNQ